MPKSSTDHSAETLPQLLARIEACRLCEKHLPLGPRPVLRAAESARILVVGQAPGTRVHASGIPWDDPSGDRLRDWLGLPKEQFYDPRQIAIIPMGLCYPGRGKSGDLPPRPECAPLWHPPLLARLPQLKLTLLIGQYAQKHYLQDSHKTLSARVRDWRNCPAGFLPLPHPSPRNTLWLRRNPWFESEVVPAMRQRVHALLAEKPQPDTA